MTFPRRLLADHEELVVELRPHWISVLPSVVWTIVLGIVLFLGYEAMDAIFTKETATQTSKSVVGGLVTLAWILLAVVPLLRWYFTMFVLTTDRLITRSGVIAKHSREIPLERINDVTFNQSVLERVLGAGDLLVESAGERGQTKIDNVRKPEQLQLMIFKEIEHNTSRTMTPAHSASGTVADQIEGLARLRDKGLLTPEEFEAKKQDLLRRL